MGKKKEARLIDELLKVRCNKKIAEYFYVTSDYLPGITNDPLEDKDIYFMLGRYGTSLTNEEKEK